VIKADSYWKGHKALLHSLLHTNRPMFVVAVPPTFIPTVLFFEERVLLVLVPTGAESGTLALPNRATLVHSIEYSGISVYPRNYSVWLIHTALMWTF
jgi:hypothetical protein